MRQSVWWKVLKWTVGVLGSLFLLITLSLYLFKDEICSYVIKEVNKNLNAEVKIANVDLAFWGSFPNLSVDFNKVFIKDPTDSTFFPDTLLYTDRIRLKFNPIDIWNDNYNVKEIQISPGTLKLKINAQGEENYNILKESTDTTASAFQLNLEDVNAEDLRFEYLNEATQQFYIARFRELELSGALSEKNFAMHAESDLNFEEARSGEIHLLRNKNVKLDLDLIVDSEKNTFELKKTTVLVEKLPFHAEGKVTPDSIRFIIRAENLKLDEVANNFALSELEDIKHYKGSGTVHFNALISGKNSKSDPVEVDCKFGIKGGNLTETSQNLRLNNISLSGQYSSLGGKAKEFLKLNDIRFKTIGGPFEGDVLITNFTAPVFQGKANGMIDLAVLQNLFSLPYVQTINGNIHVNSDFLVQKLTENQGYDVRKCEGELKLIKINTNLIDDQRLYRNLNGRIYLKNDEAGIDNISLNIGSSDLRVDGVFNQLKAYLAKKDNLLVSMSLNSRKISMQDLASVAAVQKVEDGRSFILPQNVNGTLQLNIGTLSYDAHDFNDISGNMQVADRQLRFPKLSLSNAKARVDASIFIHERSPEVFLISTSASSNNISFREVFKEWNNFDQSVILADNISGKASVDLVFEAPFDLKTGIVKSAIRSKVHILVKDGKLSKVKAFDDIVKSMKGSSARMVLKRNNIEYFGQQLANLEFKTLENTIIIENSRIEIPEMLIENNALNVVISGNHSFDNAIDYHFDFRFRDLKNTRKETEFGIEEDDGTGARIFIRMKGTLDNPIIEWDSEARKENAKENREIEKQNAKAMLRDEFGLFRKDSTVRSFTPVTKPKEEIIMQFGEDDHEQMKKEEEQNKKKPGLMNKQIEKWKKQKEEEENAEFEFE